MDDRTLLELAARANWQQEIANDEVNLRYSEADEGMLYLHADNQDHNGQDREFVWNPRIQDHDALRLAVKLDMEIYQGSDEGAAAYVGYWMGGRRLYCIEYHDDISHMGDKYSATRLAITRAAAEIGKSRVSAPGAVEGKRG